MVATVPGGAVDRGNGTDAASGLETDGRGTARGPASATRPVPGVPGLTSVLRPRRDTPVTTSAAFRAYPRPPVEPLTLIGVSHRRGGADALETYAHAYAERPVAQRLAAVGVHAWFALDTCNRFDVVLLRPADLPLARLRAALTPDGAQRRPYVYAGEAALEQLARVASSLDALNPGEDQVMRQVRDAAQAARAVRRLGGDLSFAVDAALRIAKSVRREVALAPRDASLFSLARADVEAVLGAASAAPGPRRAVVVGAGEMGQLAARSLAAIPGVQLTIVNRDADRARRVAAEHGAEARSLAEVQALGIDAEVLVAATRGGRLVDAAWLARSPSLRLAVDLGVPRTVDAAAARTRGVRVLDVDGLQAAGSERRLALEARLAQAERVLHEGVEAEMRAWAERSLAPAIRALHAWLEETLAGAVPPEEARRLAKRLAFVPVKGLRAVARDHGVAAARTFLAETGLDRPTEEHEA
jgi:glutamyl-tRNA reductase